MLKVLFVHDCAFVSRDLSTDLNRIGVETEFLTLRPTLKMALEIRKSDADIVHANYVRSPAYASFLSLKRPYVLHAHGDDVRYGVGFNQRLAMRFASKIFLSTADLALHVKRGQLLMRPVDFNLFNPKGVNKSKKAVYFLQTTSDPRLRFNEQNYIEQIRTIAKEDDFELEVHVRNISYQEMPNFLSQYSLFFDREFPKEYSKTALEAMAMEVPVYPYRVPVDEQPRFVRDHHDPRIIAKTLKDEYQRILE